MKYNINNIKDFLAEFVDFEIEIRAMSTDNIKRLPLALTHCYSFYTLTIQECQAVLVVVQEPETCSTKQLSKHQDILIKNYSQPVIFVLTSIKSYNLKRFTKARINFIMPNKIIFAPCLMMILRNITPTRNQHQDTMPPVAQLLVLYHLQKERLDGLDAYRISDLIGMAYTTTIKALKWLETKHIITFQGKKQKNVRFTNIGKELWEQTLPFMSSPVEKIFFCDNTPNSGLVAGETAMGHYTMLEEPETPVIAISKKVAKDINSLFNKQYGNIQVEVWKYNPQLLSNSEKIDRLSLYLSLKDHTDERVQMECETLINELVW